MEKLANVKLVVAIGPNGDGCIIKSVGNIDEVEVDVEEYGNYLYDFFHEGTKPPGVPGLYFFEGGAYGAMGSDLLFTYIGEFHTFASTMFDSHPKD